MSEPRMSLDLARRKLPVWERYQTWELAGVDRMLMESWRTIIATGDVLDRVRQEYADVAATNPRPGRPEHVTGYLTALDTIEQWLTEALAPPQQVGAHSIKEGE